MNQKGFAPVALLIGILVAAGLALGGTSVNKTKNFQDSKTSFQEINDNFVRVAGKYNPGSGQEIIYELSLPKNGGELSGELSGVCEGQISGTTARQSEEGKSKLKGVIHGSCQPISTLPFKTTLEAGFEGVADFINTNINVDYSITQPISIKSNLVIPFLQTRNNNVIEKEVRTSGNQNISSSQINLFGTYNISDKGSINYSLNIPRQKGSISGKGTGTCQINISGEVGDLETNGKRSINGIIEGTCLPTVTLNFRTNLNGKFWGSLDDTRGEIEVIHNGIFQEDANGSFYINYLPD